MMVIVPMLSSRSVLLGSATVVGYPQTHVQTRCVAQVPSKDDEALRVHDIQRLDTMYLEAHDWCRGLALATSATVRMQQAQKHAQLPRQCIPN